MPTTIISSFEKFRQNLEITGLQKSTVSTRQNNVREVVEAGLEVNESFLTGSYSRSTMIAPLVQADVDIFMVLNSKYYSKTPTDLLGTVRSTLRKTYTKTPKISSNGQAVTIIFTDFIVDVVPGFYRQGGGFLIPNAYSNKWIATNPRLHVELMTTQNAIHKGNLVPLVKMIKGWNRAKNKPFRSFYLELLAINILKGVTISDSSSGMRFFFDKGRELIKLAIKDPALGEYVYGLENCKNVEDAVKVFRTAYDSAVLAEKYANQNNLSLSVATWRNLLGEQFPAYG